MMLSVYQTVRPRTTAVGVLWDGKEHSVNKVGESLIPEGRGLRVMDVHGQENWVRGESNFVKSLQMLYLLNDGVCLSGPRTLAVAVLSAGREHSVDKLNESLTITPRSHIP